MIKHSDNPKPVITDFEKFSGIIAKVFVVFSALLLAVFIIVATTAWLPQVFAPLYIVLGITAIILIRKHKIERLK